MNLFLFFFKKKLNYIFELFSFTHAKKKKKEKRIKRLTRLLGFTIVARMT